MKKIYLIVLCLLSIEISANDNLKLGIVPQPTNVRMMENSFFQLTDLTTISCDQEATEITDYLIKQLKRSTGYQFKRVTENAAIRLVLNENQGTTKKEAYRLVSNQNGIVISAKYPAGLFYGVQTLLQLLPPKIYSNKIRKFKKWKIPYVEIDDEPLFSDFRGLQLDISRHFRTKQEILEIIEVMAYHKLNTLHLHLSDDEGWRIEIKQFPLLTDVGSRGNKDHVGTGPREYLTQNEVKEIISFAKERYIQIFPEVDIPGHMHAIIRSYPELGSPKDLRPDKRVIRIDDVGFQFCKKILTEIDDIFNSDYIHLGFDEVNLGADIYDDSQITDFATRMSDFVMNELGKTPILWDDAFEKGHHDQDCLTQWWRNGKNHWWSDMELSIDDKLQRLDKPFIISNAKYVYFDMAHQSHSFGAKWAGPISVAEIYNWNPYEDLVNYNPDKRHLAKGIICATWSENLSSYTLFEKMVYPRLATLSERCWANYEGDPRPTWPEYRDHILLKKQLKRYNALKLNYWGKYNTLKFKRLPDTHK